MWRKTRSANGDQRSSRAGTETPAAVRTASEHEFTPVYVRERAADQEKSSYVRPVEAVLDFDDQNRFQREIAVTSDDLAISLSYRAAADLGGSVSIPSQSPITPRVKEYERRLKKFLLEPSTGTEADAIVTDGRKCRSRDDDRTYHSVQGSYGEDIDEKSHSLRDLSVAPDWDDCLRP